MLLMSNILKHPRTLFVSVYFRDANDSSECRESRPSLSPHMFPCGISCYVNIPYNRHILDDIGVLILICLLMRT